MTFSFMARGFTVTGGLVVGEEQVELEVKLPLMARLVGSEGEIRERVLKVMREIFLTPEIHGKEQRA